MITMNELVDLRMQHMAHELYRQQIMQRIPDPFPTMLSMPISRHVILPQRSTLPSSVDANLQNNDLWKQFHQIGTEMIITKSGRRMFPSMRLSLSGLDDDANYCVLLEMVPIGDCRYKFSGSQWVPAGGAEPQSPQRMYLHPDSPASGSHWQAQPILFNKVKLTNNTLDNNGHIVLTSMHKYQPRIHIIRTSDPTQIPWAPQKSFIFPETEFVAVTAYQNDRITKLKIDNNPFAKGFRETGQSRCKRKITASPDSQQQQQSIVSSSESPVEKTSKYEQNNSLEKSIGIEENSSIYEINDNHQTILTGNSRMKSNSSACSASSLDDVPLSTSSSISSSSSSNSSGTSSPNIIDDIRNYCPLGVTPTTATPTIPTSPTSSSINNGLFIYQINQNVQSLINPTLVDLAYSYFKKPNITYSSSHQPHHSHHHPHLYQPHHHHHHHHHHNSLTDYYASHITTDSSDRSFAIPTDISIINSSPMRIKLENDLVKIPRKNNFTISAILGDDH